MQAFQHRQLGNFILTGYIRPAAEAPYFLEIIRDANTWHAYVSAIPVTTLNDCHRLLPEREAELINTFTEWHCMNHSGGITFLHEREVHHV